MLEGIRKRRNSTIILVAFAAIIVVFIFWGVGPNGGGNDPGVVASVDGEPVKGRLIFTSRLSRNSLQRRWSRGSTSSISL